MDLLDTLRQSGLTYREAKVYLAVLEHSPTSVLEVSNRTAIHRTIVYQLIADLMSRGLLQRTVFGKRKLYTAIDPKELIGQLKQQEQRLTDALPEFYALTKGKSTAQTLYFSGREQLQQLFRSGLSAKRKELRSYFPTKYMIELFGKREMEEIIDERVKRHIFGYTLRSHQTDEEFKGSELAAEAHREIRYLPEGMTIKMGIVIFDDTVNLFAPIEEGYGLQIKSRSYAEMMTMFFDSMWNQSSKSHTNNADS